MRPGVLALLVVVLVAVPARAQQQQQLSPPPRLALRLEYSRGPRTICPDEHAAAELLRGAVDYEEREDAELTVVVKTIRVGRQHRVGVVLRDRTGTAVWSREHEDPDCTDALLSGVVSTALGLATRQMNAEQTRPAPVAPAPVAPVAAPIVVTLPEPVVPPPPAAPVAATWPPGDAGPSRA